MLAALAALAGAALALAVGFLLGRAQAAGHVARTEAAAREAQQAARHATEQLERARASLAARLAEVERRTAEFDRLRAEWDEQRTAADAELGEQRQRQARVRQKQDARAEKLTRRARRLQERLQALAAAAEALEALQDEARERQREAEELRARVQTLAQQAARRQQANAERQGELEAWQARVEREQLRAAEAHEEALRKLEAVAGLSRRDAVRQLSEELQAEAKLEAAAHVKEARDEARMTANREARKVVLTAIQRLAASATIENTVSVVPLASDEMKGRVIGREGRNIRAFEAATGIEVIVDDTPEAVLLSGFDPVRREVARLSMAQLVADGRIHPARIEDVVEKTRAEVEEEIIEAGERAVIDLGIHGLHPELVRMVGRMKFRTSYGQNLLAHSIEVARLASLMAAELGLDPKKARRAGLLHDIGKVSEDEIEKPHALVGMEWAQRFQEHPEVCNAVGAHHDEIEMTTPIAPLVQAADAISGARPGARREALQNYVQRLEHLEALAGEFDGVERVFAMQAGRELRVIVNHTVISDAQAESLARDVAKRIEAEMQYPGQVKVTVIREVRATSYAR